MKYLACLLLALTWSANATADMDLDGIGDWYLHVDFEAMRGSESGKKMYAWLEEEVFDELREEAGLDLDKDVDQLIATSDGEQDIIFMLQGTVRQEHKDQVMALAATQNVELKPRKSGRGEYFFMEGDGSGGDEHFDDGAYFSFAVKDKLILTSSETTMQRLLSDGGKVALRNKGAFVSLSAENAMLDPDGKYVANGEWDSNIIKNTERAALVVSDAGPDIQLKAELVAREAAMAESLASIVRGLISLQAFNDDLDAEMVRMLKSTTVDANGKTLSISLDVDADIVIDNL